MSGWVEYDGWGCPVPKATKVMRKLEGGRVVGPFTAEICKWGPEVTHYKIVRDTSADHRPGLVKAIEIISALDAVAAADRSLLVAIVAAIREEVDAISAAISAAESKDSG